MYIQRLLRLVYCSIYIYSILPIRHDMYSTNRGRSQGRWRHMTSYRHSNATIWSFQQPSIWLFQNVQTKAFPRPTSRNPRCPILAVGKPRRRWKQWGQRPETTGFALLIKLRNPFSVMVIKTSFACVHPTFSLIHLAGIRVELLALYVQFAFAVRTISSWLILASTRSLLRVYGSRR